MSTRLAAAFRQAPSEVSAAGERHHLAPPVAGLLVAASARARPMWPWLARAANAATPRAHRARRPGSRPPRRAVGVVSATLRQRDRIVGRTSSSVGAHSSHTVLGVGSSIALSSALPVRLVPEPVGVLDTITCQRRSTGAQRRRGARGRACRRCRAPTSRSACTLTSGWVPASAVGTRGTRRSRRRGTAARRRTRARRWTGPSPGGPVNSQAWVMPCPATAAERSIDVPLADQGDQTGLDGSVTAVVRSLGRGSASLGGPRAARLEQRLEPGPDLGGRSRSTGWRASTTR